MYLGKKSSWLTTFYRFPKEIKRFHFFYGNILVRLGIFSGVISTIMWVLINNSEFYKDIHNHLVIYGILSFGMFIIVYQDFKTNYNKYQLS